MRGRLVRDHRAGVTVIVDAGGVDQGGHAPLGDRLGEHLGRLDAAVGHHLLAGGAPPHADPGAAQVDHRVHAVEGVLVDVACRRVPGELVRPVRRAPDESPHLVPGMAQRAGQRCADESARPGDQYSHLSIICVPAGS